jgi:hypothetical protein
MKIKRVSGVIAAAMASDRTADRRWAAQHRLAAEHRRADDMGTSRGT